MSSTLGEDSKMKKESKNRERADFAKALKVILV
jgi:hypothetical protein